MKQHNKFMALTFIIVIIVMAVINISLYRYYNPEDPLEWCLRKRPEFNQSGRARLCYTEYWAEYCKIRAPTYCPDYKTNLAQRIEENVFNFSVPIDNITGIR